jgi:hypothetical protein
MNHVNFKNPNMYAASMVAMAPLCLETSLNLRLAGDYSHTPKLGLNFFNFSRQWRTL